MRSGLIIMLVTADTSYISNTMTMTMTFYSLIFLVDKDSTDAIDILIVVLLTLVYSMIVLSSTNTSV